MRRLYFLALVGSLLVLVICLGGADTGLAQIDSATGGSFSWRDYQDPGQPTKPQDPLWQTTLWFFLKLAFVVGLVFAVLYGYRKVLGIRVPASLGTLRILESARLAGTQSLYVVQAGERRLLVGSNGAGMMVKLAEWSVTEGSPPPAVERSFAQDLKDASRRRDDFEGIIDSAIRESTSPRPDELRVSLDTAAAHS